MPRYSFYCWQWVSVLLLVLLNVFLSPCSCTGTEAVKNEYDSLYIFDDSNNTCLNEPNGVEKCNIMKEGWYCPVPTMTHVYLGCPHQLSAIFHSKQNVLCSSVQNYKSLKATVNDATISVTNSTLNNSVDCCLVSFSFDVQKNNNTIILLVSRVSPFKVFYCACQYLLNIVETLSSVENISAVVSCDYVNISWTPPDILDGYKITGYNVTVDGINITKLVNKTHIILDIIEIGLEPNSRYNVTVMPLYCGGFGNASSAVVTIAMKPQFSQELEYVVQRSNSTSVSVYFQTKSGCPVSYPTNVSIVLHCDGSPQYKTLAIPTILPDSSILLSNVILPVNKTCAVTLEWKNMSPDTYTQKIALRTIPLLSSIQSELNTFIVRPQYCILSCCGSEDDAMSTDHVVNYTGLDTPSMSHTACQNTINLFRSPESICTGKLLVCNDSFSLICSEYIIDDVQPSPSSSQSPSETTKAPTPTTIKEHCPEDYYFIGWGVVGFLLLICIVLHCSLISFECYRYKKSGQYGLPQPPPQLPPPQLPPEAGPQLPPQLPPEAGPQLPPQLPPQAAPILGSPTSVPQPSVDNPSVNSVSADTRPHTPVVHDEESIEEQWTTDPAKEQRINGGGDQYAPGNTGEDTHTGTVDSETPFIPPPAK